MLFLLPLLSCCCCAEYVLEVCESGSFYRPITPEDLAAGLPPPQWCMPLHVQLQQAASPATLQAQLFNQEHSTLQSLATATLRTAQYWCLVHKCVPGLATVCSIPTYRRQ